MAKRNAAKTAEPTSFVEPQLATLVKAAPEGDDWLHEIKFDGYRILSRLERGHVTLLSRRGLDWTDHYPEIARAVARLPARRAWLDGEVAVLLPDGRTSFQALQNVGEQAGTLVYFVFDLLAAEDEDLTKLPLEARKARLAALLERADDHGPLRFSDHVVGKGPAFFREACARKLEGIVSKLRHEPYRSGRTRSWLKTKCGRRQELVIGGFTEPDGKREGIGALLVGAYDEHGKLRFAGKVGTGYTQAIARDLRRKLNALARASSPFDPPPPRAVAKDARWAQPQLVAEVAFSEWTEDGKLRHPSFQGLRADRPPGEVHRERSSMPPPPRAKPPRAGSTSQTEVAGVRVSHPDRVLYPGTDITKLALARYFETVAPHMLPHLLGRPLTLVRCPDGVGASCFYMKHSNVWAPKQLRRVPIQEKTKVGQYLVVEDVAGLVALAQMGVLELHTWNSTVDHVDLCDRIVLDLDPGPDVGFPAVVEAARLVRQALLERGLQSFVKTTGGKGLHVVAPLLPEHDWDTCLAFSREVASSLERESPRRYTTAMPKRGREAKILVDYLRNNRGSTSVAAFSTRAREGAPVSTPLAWDELGPRLRPDRFTLATVPPRLASQTADPWHDYAHLRQALPRATRRARPA